MSAVVRAVKVVAGRLNEMLEPDGLTVVQTNRPAGWQDVFHLHVHLVPRWDGDALIQPWTPASTSTTSLASVAERLRFSR